MADAALERVRGLAQRARIVLLAGQGVANAWIAAQVGVSVPTVPKWRGRVARTGLASLSLAAFGTWTGPG